MAYEIKIETGASIQSVEELKKQIDALKASLEGLNKATEEYAKISKQIADAEKQLSSSSKETAKSLKDVVDSTEKAGSSLGKAGTESKKATDNFKIMRDEIKQLKSDFAGTAAGTQEYDDALLALSNKMRDFNDMNKMIRASAADTGQILGNITGTVKGIAGSFEAASGALELFGVSTAKLQDVEKRTMGIIKVVQGLAAAEDGLTKKLPYLVKQYQSINAQIKASIASRKAAKTATDAETVADTAQATASSQAAKAELQQAGASGTLAAAEGTATTATFSLTGAFNALKAAIASNPLGAILTALSTLLIVVPLVTNAFKKMGDESGKSVVDLGAELDKLIQKADIEIEIFKIKNPDVSAVDMINKEIEILEQAKDRAEHAGNAKIQQTREELRKTFIFGSGELRKQINKDTDEMNSRLDELQNRIDNLIISKEIAFAKDEMAASTEADKANADAEAEAQRRAERAAAAAAARNDALDNFVKSLQRSLMTQEQLENDSYAEQQKKLDDAIKYKRISQETYDELSEKAEKAHLDRLEKIRADAAKKQKDEEEKEAQEKEAKANKQRQEAYGSTSAQASNLSNDYNSRASIVASDYERLIALSKSEIEQADLAIQKEQTLFDLKKQSITQQLQLYQALLETQEQGTEEYAKTEQAIRNLLASLEEAENKHNAAVVDGEKKKQEAIQNTDEAIAQQTRAYVSAVNDIVDKISDLIGMYAEEAKERADNEELSIEAREKAFEESKKYQVAQTIISTLQGIVSAWSSAMQLPWPANVIVGGANSTLLTGIGIANIAKIKSQKLGGSGSNIGNSGSASNISIPAYTGPQDNININRPATEDMRVYVVEEDITTTQDTMKTRVAESTF